MLLRVLFFSLSSFYEKKLNSKAAMDMKHTLLPITLGLLSLLSIENYFPLNSTHVGIFRKGILLKKSF